jgi:hypothetical protein
MLYNISNTMNGTSKELEGFQRADGWWESAATVLENHPGVAVGKHV